MGYLLTEIVVYLVIAGLIGFAFGWLVRDGALDKYCDKLVSFLSKIWVTIKGLFEKLKSAKTEEKIVDVQSVKATTEDVKKTEETVTEVIKEDVKEIIEEVAPVKIAEEIKEEVKVEEPIKEVLEETVVEVATQEQEDVTKPTLLTKAPSTGADKLSALKGIGPVLEKKLNELGIYTYEQIASWDTEQEVWIGTQMAFPKRVTKEEWVKQAKEFLKNK